MQRGEMRDPFYYQNPKLSLSDFRKQKRWR